MAQLMLSARPYSQWPLDKASAQIVPPIALRQYCLYHTPDGESVGFATWAHVSDSVKDALISGHRPLMWDDWNSGDLLLINDIVAPFGHERDIVNSLRQTLFAHRKALGVRRSASGSNIQVLHWTGRHYRPGTAHSEAPPPPLPTHMELRARTHAG